MRGRPKLTLEEKITAAVMKILKTHKVGKARNETPKKRAKKVARKVGKSRKLFI